MENKAIFRHVSDSLNRIGAYMKPICFAIGMMACFQANAAQKQATSRSETSNHGSHLRSVAMAKPASLDAANLVPPDQLILTQDPLASSNNRERLYGSSLAIDGATLAVGAEMGVYVYRHSGGSWIKEQRLASKSDDYFVVRSLSVSGNRVAYAEAGDEFGEELSNGVGSVNIYKRSDGAWIKEAELFDDTGAYGNPFDFGFSVSVDDDELIAGGTSTQPVAPFQTRPKIKFYSFEGGIWRFQRDVVLADILGFPANRFQYGISKLLLTTNRILVSETFGRTLMLLRKVDGTWVYETAFDTQCNTCYAYGGDILVIDRTIYREAAGAWLIDAILPSGSGDLTFDGQKITYASGEVYLRTSGGWSREESIGSIAGPIASSTAGLVRAANGSAYAYAPLGRSWTQSQTLLPDYGMNFADFGAAVAMVGDVALVGAPFDDYLNGAAYIMRRDVNGWTTEFKLTPNTPDFYSRFAREVSLTADYAVANNQPDCYHSGNNNSVYVFKRTATGWVQDARLQNPSIVTSYCRDTFGYSPALSGSYLVLINGADVLLYQRGAARWELRSTLGAESLGLQRATVQHRKVDIQGDTIALISTGVDTGGGANRNLLSLFRISGSGVSLQQKLSLSAPATTLSLTSNVVATLANGVITMFGRDSNSWRQLSTVVPAAGTGSFDQAKVANGVLVARLSTGVVDVYTRKGDQWLRKAQVSDPRTRDQPSVNSSIAVSGERILIGDAEYSEFANSGGVVRSFTIASDYGDAPDSYKTLRSNGGARHFLDGPKFGSRIDADLDGSPTVAAIGDDVSGDDDEDGVSFPILVAGAKSTLQVVVANGPAKIDAWIDLDGDGAFAATERVVNNFTVQTGTTPLAFDLPAPARGQYARVRVSTDGVSGPSGTSVDGEVEDELVSIRSLVVRVASASTVEGNGGTRLLNFEFTLNAPPLVSTTVHYATADETATAGVDYVAQSGAVTFAPGETRKTVAVVILGDSSIEPDETFQIRYSSVSGSSYIFSAIGTIVNDDTPTGIPGVKVNVSRYDFGNVAVGSQSAPRALTVTSTGTAPLEINSIRISGDFTGSSQCPRVLAPGASCQLTGVFKPTARGVRTGTATLTTNAPSSPTVIELRGNGT